ncbi:hypothetical protein [Streptomyces sp. NPDC050988]|uniref:hypothetical protein n=1 Tax=Streptomyces sp. NPDC050988 TaxID=3365637 RepID=UPI0037952382
MIQQPSPEELQKIRDELREEIREARGTLKDLRREIKTARELVPLLTDELFEAEVKKQVDALGTATEAAMDQAVKRVFAKFDQLQAVATGEDRHSRRRGQPSIPDLLRARVGIEADRD